MPPKHFVTGMELTHLRGKHAIMSEEDRQWLQANVNRIHETMQYHIQGRTSMDDALRLFLIADKDFSLENALDMNISPAEMKQYYEEFFQTYADPDKSPEENLYLIGDLHRRALEKIQEYRFPDYSDIRSVEDFVDVHTFFEKLSGLITSMDQDTQISDPDLKIAYYAGAGGKSNLKKLAYPIEMAYGQMNIMLPYLDHPEIEYPPDTKAQYLKLCRNQIIKYSNQKIRDMKLSVLYSNDAIQRIAMKTDLMKNEDKGHHFPQEGMEEYQEYLNGGENDIPQSAEFEQAMSQEILVAKQSLTGSVTLELRNKYERNGLSRFLSYPHPEDSGDGRDIFRLSPDEQKRLQSAYIQIFDGAMTGFYMDVFYEMGIDEFDLIKVRGGESISQMVSRKYPGLDEETRFRALMMETVRHALTDGVVVMDSGLNPGTGDITLKNGFEMSPKTEAELRAEESKAMEEGLSATMEERESLYRREDGGYIGSADALTPEQKEAAAGMYDRIFGPALDSFNMRDYRLLHPEKQDVDFFRVGGMSLRSYLGEDRMNALMNAGTNALKAEILRMATDPTVPLSLSTVKYDALNDEYSERTTLHVMDAENKLRIRTEYPYLNSLEAYKKWMAAKYGEQLGQAAQTLLLGFDDEAWTDMYHSEFHHAAVSGFTIPRDKVVSREQLAERAEDPVNPHALSFENLKTIYGPKPMVVEGWVGANPGDNIYTKDNFQQHSVDLGQENFTDGDFTLLAFYAALSPDVVVNDPYQNIPAEWISRQDQFLNSSCMWTMDICAPYPNPRTNFGDAFLECAIKPARTAASDMIRNYEAGDQEQMVGILADGLKRMVKYMMTTSDLDKSNGQTSFKLHMLRKTNEMLERYPEVREAVMGRLTAEEQEDLRVFLRLEHVVDQALHAKSRLAEAKKNQEELPPEVMEELTGKVDAYNFYAAAWDHNRNAFLQSPEYMAFDRESSRVLIQRSTANPGSLAPGEARNSEMLVYQMNHMKLGQDLKEALLSEDPFRVSEKIRGSLNRLERYFTDEWQTIRRTEATLRRAAGADQNEAGQNGAGQNVAEPAEVTAEACDAAVRDQEESIRRLDALRLLLEADLGPVRVDEVRKEYNREARISDWPEIESFEAGRETMSPVQHPERYEFYFDQLLEVYRDNIKRCYRMEEKLDRIKIPTDPDFEDKLDHPLQNRFVRLNRFLGKLGTLNNEYMAADREKFAGVADHLAEVKENVAASIERANDPSKGNAFRMKLMLEGTEGYNAAGKEFSGLFEKMNAGSGIPKVKVITEETRSAYQSLLTSPPEISEALRNKGLHAIAMMEDRSMLQEGSDSRTMAHGRTVRLRTELAAAVERSPIPAILEADERYLEAYNAEKEVFDYVKESFDAGSWVPDKMTLTGEKKVPPEFVQDPAVDSRMNALWQVGMTAKRLGVSTEDFIRNPGLYLINDLQRKLLEKGLSSMTEPGDDFITSIGKLYSKGRELVQGESLKNKVLGGLTAEEYVEKAVGNLYLLEEDPERRRSLAVYTKKLSQVIDAAIERENAECTCIYQMMRTGVRVNRKSAEALREGLKSAFLTGSAIGKEHLPVPYTNGEGMAEDRPVKKYQDLLARKDAYAELTAIYKKNLPNAKTADRKDMRLLIQETMLDYLCAHPEDRDKKEYKNLEKLALNADVEMQIPQPANEAERDKRPKARYEHWKHDFAEELRNLDNAVVRRDQDLNRDILRLQREADNAARGRNANRALAWERMEQIETRIRERQEQLLTAWHKKEITDSYFRARYDDLHTVLLNPGQRLKNPPKFSDKRDPEQYAKDMKLISNRVSYSFGEKYLRSLDSFREWKRKQWDTDQAAIANYSEAEWKKQYRRELSNDSKRRGTPNWIKEKNAEAEARIQARRQQRQQELGAQNHNAVQNNQPVQNHAAPNNAGVHHAPGHGPGI